MNERNPRLNTIAEVMAEIYSPMYLVGETIQADEGEFGLGGLSARLDARGKILGRFTDGGNPQLLHLAKPESDAMVLQLTMGWLMYAAENGYFREEFGQPPMEEWAGTSLDERYVIVDGTFCFKGRIDPSVEDILGRIEVRSYRKSSNRGNGHIDFKYVLTGAEHGKIHSGTTHFAMLRDNLEF